MLWAIGISGYPDFFDNRIFGPQSYIFRARKLKLGENHVGTSPYVMGYSDSQIL